eukprot:5495189-Lingulodinium_polyedra.AAC.1
MRCQTRRVTAEQVAAQRCRPLAARPRPRRTKTRGVPSRGLRTRSGCSAPVAARSIAICGVVRTSSSVGTIGKHGPPKQRPTKIGNCSMNLHGCVARPTLSVRPFCVGLLWMQSRPDPCRSVGTA